MKIYSMTATFGKLENQTLTLKPGLNVIHAPNEWGKTTWCAFLVAMLYGIDTRERTTQTSLADKEHYKPWSGSPMSGRMDINWNGKDITIERTSRGRVAMGEFNAYETATGLPVPELTATNCGQQLLGVERSVFTRSAFIRLTDLPVTEDESLRRRLNALVTTGDESGASDALAQKLKDLKNGCRHNKTGLLPQAEAQRAALEDKLRQLAQLQSQCADIRQRQEALAAEIQVLENHRTALEYNAAQENIRRVEAAVSARNAAAEALASAKQKCAGLPSVQEAKDALLRLEQLQQSWTALQAEALPVMPEPVTAPAPFTGLTGEQAVQQAQSDYSALQMLSKPLSPVLMICAVLFALLGLGFAFVKWYLLLPFLVPAVVFYLAHQRGKAAQAKDKQAVLFRYGVIPPEQWCSLAQKYRDALVRWSEQSSGYKQQAESMRQRRETLTRETESITEGQPVSVCISSWKRVLEQHDALQEAQRNWENATRHAEALSHMAKPVTPPAFEDALRLSPEETNAALANKTAEHRLLERQLGQAMGQMQSLGSPEVIQQRLDEVNARIIRLEDTYQALVLAQQTLASAADELQRRFAPKLTQKAQTLFGRLTDGRYERLTLGQDLSVSAGAVGENALYGSLWRSDGTADQLYLALRLAVSGELTPDSPLVLDDALVRFDDDRLALAMALLKEEAAARQIILFTCQTREVRYDS